MTPTQAIAALDRQLRLHGQDVTLQRLSPPSLAVSASVTVRAKVSDFTLKELDGAIGMQIGDSKVIMSPTEVNEREWPAANEVRVPRKGDRIIAGGRTRTVLHGWGRYLNDELVRIELMIR